MDKFSKKTRSRIMSRIRSKRTKPEIAAHNLLKGNRIRHKMWPDMFGKPDILIGEINTVVFINGCFWHGCREHFRLPKTNKKFWRDKIKRNITRQKLVITKLKKMGFNTIVVWEHDLK